jgi:hypothetical protein
LSGWIYWLLILILLPAALLSLPLTFKAQGRLDTEEGQQQLEARLAWGWGLLAVTAGIDGRKKSLGIRLAGIALPASRKTSGTVKAKKPRKKTVRQGKKSPFNFSTVIAVLNRQFINTMLAYLKKIISSCRLRLHLKGVYGTDDPALTGLLAGLMAALRTGHFRPALEADFNGPILDVDLKTSGRIIPITVLGLTMGLLLAGPVRKLWWGLLKNKFSRRKQKEVVQYV